MRRAHRKWNQRRYEQNLAAAPLGRSLRLTSCRSPLTGVRAPPHTGQQDPAPCTRRISLVIAFTIHAPPTWTTPMATREWSARRAAHNRLAMNATAAVDVRRCASRTRRSALLSAGRLRHRPGHAERLPQPGGYARLGKIPGEHPRSASSAMHPRRCLFTGLSSVGGAWLEQATSCL